MMAYEPHMATYGFGVFPDVLLLTIVVEMDVAREKSQLGT